jgi:UDP-N-acetylmuramoyl-L-alanyl-D-glutamate--2,6-diaminopimelate ligase
MNALHPIEQISRSLSELARFLGVELSQGVEGETPFYGISDDSRTVISGDLFVALPGAHQHGAEFIDELVDRGVAAIVTDLAGAAIIADKLPTLVIDQPALRVGDIAAWFYQSPFLALAAVGITGTNGKTTTATLLNQIWQFADRLSGVIGTVGIWIGEEEYPARFTTPQAATLQTIAAAMRERHVKNLVMEVSSHAIDQKRISGARYAIAAFTNLTQDHLDYHKTMANYFATKAKLFTAEYSGSAIINIDDYYGKVLADECEVAVQKVSRHDHSADWYYERYEALPHGRGYEVAIRGSGGILIEGHLPLLGEHNLDNALLAIALAVTTEVDPMVIASTMHFLKAPAGRLEPVDLGQKFIALVDYAHTPDAVKRTLVTARSVTAGRVIAVLGCGGDRDAGKRSLMGDALVAGADLAIFTSDNPRSEDPALILEQMMGSHAISDHLVAEADRRGAIAIAIAEATDGDCVIVLGKGHELGQEIKGIKYPFDDRIELARAIEQLS